MKKTIIAVLGTERKGKTGTLKEFVNVLKHVYPEHNQVFPSPGEEFLSDDFTRVLEVKGQRIGIETADMPGPDIESRLLQLADEHACSIILCASRTKGEASLAIDSLVRNRDFEVIRTSTYQVDAGIPTVLVNVLKGKHILELLQMLGRL